MVGPCDRFWSSGVAGVSAPGASAAASSVDMVTNSSPADIPPSRIAGTASTSTSRLALSVSTMRSDWGRNNPRPIESCMSTIAPGRRRSTMWRATSAGVPTPGTLRDTDQRNVS